VQESDGADIVVDLPEGFLDDAKEE
jgi:hypothetical protein